MKGTILDFLKLASEQPKLAEELIELAAKHQFEFTDEVSDEELDGVSGGTAASFAIEALQDASASEIAADEMRSAEPVVTTAQDAIVNLMDSIKEIADIQKAMFDSTNTQR